MARQAVFYYPVQLQGDDGILIYYAYETATTQGVTLLLDEKTREVVTFSTVREASLFCHAMNAHQRVFPRHLPTTALRFVLTDAGRMRYQKHNGRCFLIVPVGV